MLSLLVLDPLQEIIVPNGVVITGIAISDVHKFGGMFFT